MLASIIISCVSPSVLSNFPELQQLSRVCIGDSNFQGSVHLGCWWGVFRAVEIKRPARSGRS